MAILHHNIHFSHRRFGNYRSDPLGHPQGLSVRENFPDVKRLTPHGVSRLRFSPKRQVYTEMAYGFRPFPIIRIV